MPQVRHCGGRGSVQMRCAVAGDLQAEADAAHAASMAALGLLPRRWRRAALTDALIAATLTAVGIALARADPGEPAASGWWSERNRYADRLTGLGPTADAEA